MRKTHKVKNLKPTKDFSFQKYFNVEASPHTQFHFDQVGRIIYDYIPKNGKRKSTERLVFAAGKHGHGSYIRQKHGDLK